MKSLNTQEISLESLYSSLMTELLHIRSSSMNYIFAYYGYLVLSIGFIITQNGAMSINNKKALYLVTLALGLLSIFTSLIFRIKANEISRGLCNIERYWHCYTKKKYLVNETLLPKTWASLKSNKWTNPEFYFQIISSYFIISKCLLIIYWY
jgi:hypothetical protein